MSGEVENLLRQAATAPNTGMDLTRLAAFLQILNGTLSSGDYNTAISLMLQAVAPGYAAAVNAGTQP